jgi:hypothetical protein
MPESMDPKLVEQLNIVCDGYARRLRLSGDGRQEVFDHLQDSLDGYLNGQTRVTPEDALLIARARLGDVKGIVAQLRPQRADNACNLTRIRVAIGTAFLTIFVLPVTMLLLDPPAGGNVNLLQALKLLVHLFILAEAGVFLAARVDMKSRWQRGVSLALMLPAVLILCAMLISTPVRMLRITSASVIGAVLLHALAITCLAGHATLALILLTPMKREPVAAVQ